MRKMRRAHRSPIRPLPVETGSVSPERALRALWVAALIFCMAVAAMAQSTNSSDLRGTVTDSTGAKATVAQSLRVTVETGSQG